MAKSTVQTINETQQPTPFSTITLSLMLSMFLSGFPTMLLSLFISDMAQLFSVEVGVIGFVRSVSEASSVVMGVVLGGLSVRYRQKSLLVIGIVIMCVSTLASGFVSLFLVFGALFAMFGLSKVMLRSMSNALIGQFFSLDQRPKISGYLTAGMAGAYTVGAILAATATDFRHISLFVLFPLSALALALVWKGIPPKDLTIQRNPLYAFREVFRDRSAVMCLVSNTLAYMGPNTSWVTFFVPFFLQTFPADQAVISIVFLAATLLLIAGTIVGGQLVNRVGRKPLWSSMIGAASLACFGYIFAPNFELSVALWILAGFLFGISMPAYTSLLLEHVPEYRGTVMSLSETSQFIAQALGSGSGAVILLTYGFAGLGWFSLTGIIAAVLSYFFTTDPTTSSKRR